VSGVGRERFSVRARMCGVGGIQLELEYLRAEDKCFCMGLLLYGRGKEGGERGERGGKEKPAVGAGTAG
jgi:hypothetical protein